MGLNMQKYLSPIKRLGGFALLFLIIGLVFPSLSAGIGDERVRDGVLIRAVPFVAFFIMVLLLYILVIVLVARRFNGKLPNRAHRPIELMAIAGILCGVVFLFQPFFFVSYRYGFLLVLIRAEELSLLLGAIGLTLLLALAMYLTRRLDWYSAAPTEQSTADTP